MPLEIHDGIRKLSNLMTVLVNFPLHSANLHITSINPSASLSLFTQYAYLRKALISKSAGS